MKTVESIYEEYQQKRMDAFYGESYWIQCSFYKDPKEENQEEAQAYSTKTFLEYHHEFKLNDTMCKIMEKYLL